MASVWETSQSDYFRCCNGWKDSFLIQQNLTFCFWHNWSVGLVHRRFRCSPDFVLNWTCHYGLECLKLQNLAFCVVLEHFEDSWMIFQHSRFFCRKVETHMCRCLCWHGWILHDKSTNLLVHGEACGDSFETVGVRYTVGTNASSNVKQTLRFYRETFRCVLLTCCVDLTAFLEFMTASKGARETPKSFLFVPLPVPENLANAAKNNALKLWNDLSVNPYSESEVLECGQEWVGQNASLGLAADVR